jgi:phosphatidylinositol alpha-1,6-mannosyltransferase
MKRRRVLILTPDFPPAHGGIQLLVHRVVAGWDQLDATVVTFEVDGHREFDRAQSFGVRRVAQAKRSRALGIGSLNARGLGQGLRSKPDAVLCAHIVCSPAATALGLRGIPIVQYLYAKEVDGRPMLARFAISRADKVVAISGYTRQIALRLGARRDSLHVIPPGVDLPGTSGSQRAKRPTIVTVSRLRDAYKGHDVVLEALPRIREEVPDVRWVIVGDGPLRASLEHDVSLRALEDSVEFVGVVSDEERDVWLDRAWVFAMPSRTPPRSMSGEGFGIVYLEAGAHAIPVLAGNVGGAVDAVEHGHTGLLVDPTDPIAVADSLSRLLLDRAFAASLGAAGLERAEHFAWPLIAARVQDEILSLIERSEHNAGTRRH